MMTFAKVSIYSFFFAFFCGVSGLHSETGIFNLTKKRALERNGGLKHDGLATFYSAVEAGSSVSLAAHEERAAKSCDLDGSRVLVNILNLSKYRFRVSMFLSNGALLVKPSYTNPGASEDIFVRDIGGGIDSMIALKRVDAPDGESFTNIYVIVPYRVHYNEKKSHLGIRCKHQDPTVSLKNHHDDFEVNLAKSGQIKEYWASLQPIKDSCNDLYYVQGTMNSYWVSFVKT